jgi:hypothetical protein
LWQATALGYLRAATNKKKLTSTIGKIRVKLKNLETSDERANAVKGVLWFRTCASQYKTLEKLVKEGKLIIHEDRLLPTKTRKIGGLQV